MKRAGWLATALLKFRQRVKRQRYQNQARMAERTGLLGRLKRALLQPFHALALLGVRLMLASPLMAMPRQTRQRWEAALLAIVGIITVIGVTIGGWRALNQEMLRSAAASTAYMAEAGLAENDHKLVQGMLGRLGYFSGVASVRVYDANGMIFERWHSAGMPTRDEDQQRFISRMLDMDIYQPITNGERMLGGVLVTASADHLLTTLREALLLSIGLSGVLLLIIYIWYRRRQQHRRLIVSRDVDDEDRLPSLPMGGHHASLLEGMLSFKSEIDTAYTRLLYQATHDSLTRAYNRFYFDLFFEHAMKHGQEQGERFGLIFIDCNRFKEINDNHGHLAGDQVLQVVARRLQRRFEGIGEVFRYGGDEFAILVQSLPNEGYLQSLVDEVPPLFDKPIHIERIGTPLTLGVACGGACYPADGDTARQLMHSADSRMFNCKVR